MSNKYGSKYLASVGYVLQSGDSFEFKHRFGGDSWKIVDADPIQDAPILVFVLDLMDQNLSRFGSGQLSELPICSYLNSDIWLGEQIYEIRPENRQVLIKKRVENDVHLLAEEDRLPNPLPEQAVNLREMDEWEYPKDEDSYWGNMDSFLGGATCFRVAGSPLWLQNEVSVICSCGASMIHVVSMGYEGWNGPYNFIPDKPFFVGEAAMYFFFCPHCLLMKVISQPS